MEMQQVRYFLAVARTLNFTRAAEECNVTQPSLTRAIKQLEAELGGDLFRRERPQAIMTELGERMHPLLKQCYDSAVGAKLLASSIKGGEIGSLRLALSQSVDLALLTPHIKEMARHFSNLELRLLRGTGAEVAELLKKGDAELGLGGGLEESWERLDRWPLFEECFYLVLNRAHRLANRDTVALSDLPKERFLLRPYCESTGSVSVMLSEAGIDLSNSNTVASEQDLFALIEADVGVGVVPCSASVPPSLARAQISGLDFRRTVYLYGVAGRQRTAVASAIMKMLRAADWSCYLN